MVVSTSCLAILSVLSARGVSGQSASVVTFWLPMVRNNPTRLYQFSLKVCPGSVQGINGIPDDVKAVFRTAFELDPHDLIDMAAARGPFIDQSQSFSLFVGQPTSAILVSLLSRPLNTYSNCADLQMDLALHAWRSGLKTGAYYVRSKPATDPQPFGVSRSSLVARPTSPQLHSDAVSATATVCPCDV